MSTHAAFRLLDSLFAVVIKATALWTPKNAAHYARFLASVMILSPGTNPGLASI